MTEEPDPLAEGGPVDEQIRRLAPDPRAIGCPAGIGVRVLGKVRRRRRALRAGYAAAAVVALAMIGLSARGVLESNRPGSQLASETKGIQQPSVDREDAGPAELDSGYLAVPPPVFSLNLISEDQIAMLNCLEALEEEFK